MRDCKAVAASNCRNQNSSSSYEVDVHVMLWSSLTKLAFKVVEQGQAGIPLLHQSMELLDGPDLSRRTWTRHLCLTISTSMQRTPYRSFLRTILDSSPLPVHDSPVLGHYGIGIRHDWSGPAIWSLLHSRIHRCVGGGGGVIHCIGKPWSLLFVYDIAYRWRNGSIRRGSIITLYTTIADRVMMTAFIIEWLSKSACYITFDSSAPLAEWP